MKSYNSPKGMLIENSEGRLSTQEFQILGDLNVSPKDEFSRIAGTR